MASMKVLGIETSCDETAVAVVESTGRIVCNLVHTQLKEHEKFKGVVPEIAARAHLEILPSMLRQCMDQSYLTFQDLDAIAVTAGPGLIGGVIVGVMMAKSIASVHEKPFLAINHLVAHALTSRMTDHIEFPYLILLVSGGHCQMLIAHDSDNFQLLGSTLDDAVGEAFDKTARLLSMPYPGGPEIEKSAATGDALRFSLPHPLINNPKYGMNFSFSGLKTAVRDLAYQISPLQPQDVSDICASFQKTVADILSFRCAQGLMYAKENNIELKHFVVAGGVAANLYLRSRLTSVAAQFNINFSAPPLNLCTDNAAMVAWAGIEKLKKGSFDDFGFLPKPRWQLPHKREEDV